jgi:cobyrinic acid a,c-diamide synthase
LGRDGLVTQNVFAAYTHLHAAATPQWAAGILNAARQFALHAQTHDALQPLPS